MRAIRSKDTGIELALRRELHRRGHRYRKHYTGLPGKPDLVFVRERVAVFCDNEFWHGYEWAVNKRNIRSNRSYWIPKIEATIARDARVTAEIELRGWIVLRFWGKDILKSPARCARRIETVLARRSSQ